MSNDPWRNHHQALTWKAFSDFNPLHAKSDNKKIHAFPRIFYGNDSRIALSSLLWIRLVHRTQRASSPGFSRSSSGLCRTRRGEVPSEHSTRACPGRGVDD
jgi:hypothetical protein